MMDAILFHPETSMRRALILALGTYGTEGLSPGEREPLIGKLLDLYRNDPDSGIHGAAEWTLRQWKQQEKLKELDAELMKLKDRGDRRWYVNSQGQTFAVIDGPVEFRMGSPPTEPDRIDDETLHRRVSFPVGSPSPPRRSRSSSIKRFVKDRTPVRARLRATLDRYSPDPEGPMIGVSWYHGRRLLQLAERAGELAERPVVLPSQRGGDYAEGMTIPADVLERTGYRLPTEAEWEYACRAGAVTSRYLRPVDRAARASMPGIRPTARTMPGRAAACCQTTWGCSTCWETCMNGVRTVGMLTRPAKKGNM